MATGRQMTAGDTKSQSWSDHPAVPSPQHTQLRAANFMYKLQTNFVLANRYYFYTELAGIPFLKKTKTTHFLQLLRYTYCRT